MTWIERRKMMNFLHILIYILFLLGLAYAAVFVFTTPRTDMIARRLYALEFWLITGFFCIYFALTNAKELFNNKNK